MGNHRKFDHDAILNLLAGGISQAEIAKRIGMSAPGVSQIVNKARVGGDPRVAKKRDVSHKLPVKRGVSRPDAMTVNVTTMWRDGTVVATPITLPRLSILDGWTGHTTAHSSRGAA